VGALVNDRQSAIVVSHSAKAPVIPIKVSIHGAPGFPSSNWSFEVAHDKFMTPSFAAVALGSALQEVANEHQERELDRVRACSKSGASRDYPAGLRLAIGGTPEPVSSYAPISCAPWARIMNNPWQSVIIEGAAMDIKLRFARDILRLRGAEVLESEIDAGSPARIRLTLVPYSGPRSAAS